MDNREVLKAMDNITEEQAENIMVEFDNCYNDDDVNFTKKGEVLCQLYIKANDKEKEVINNVLANLCGYNLKSLIENSLGNS